VCRGDLALFAVPEGEGDGEILSGDFIIFSVDGKELDPKLHIPRGEFETHYEEMSPEVN